MADQARQLIRQIHSEAALAVFAGRLRQWLIDDLNRGGEDPPAFTESRARALLNATDNLDEPTRHAFDRLVQSPAARRVALHDLMDDTGLASHEEVAALAAVAGAAGATAAAETESETEAQVPEIEWLSLAIAAAAWHREYPLYQLDPASPPGGQSPAGQVVRAAAHFCRRQVQRSATDREKLAKELAPRGDGVPDLDSMPGADAPIAPVPPYYRSPVPVRYPEMARETLQIDPDAPVDNTPAATRGEPLVITDDDLDPEPTAPVRQPPITISESQVRPATPPSPLPRSGVIVPGPSRGSAPQARPGMLMSIRQMLGNNTEMKSTKLQVLAQEYPDGPGLYGLQVLVTCQGVKSNVAGVTDRNGVFVCELPVPLDGGLTYDVDLTWPRDDGGEVERKSITLNADRTRFELPFYRRLSAGT